MTIRIMHALCSILLLLYLAKAMSAQELPATHYTTEKEINPLPGPAVTGLWQDRAGYLWLCTYGSGLVRYDGHRMEVYNEADGLSDPATWAVQEDSMGRLWVAAVGGIVVSAEPLTHYAKGERLAFVSRVGNTRLSNQTVT